MTDPRWDVAGRICDTEVTPLTSHASSVRVYQTTDATKKYLGGQRAGFFGLSRLLAVPLVLHLRHTGTWLPVLLV